MRLINVQVRGKKSQRRCHLCQEPYHGNPVHQPSETTKAFKIEDGDDITDTLIDISANLWEDSDIWEENYIYWTAVIDGHIHLLVRLTDGSGGHEFRSWNGDSHSTGATVACTIPEAFSFGSTAASVASETQSLGRSLLYSRRIKLIGRTGTPEVRPYNEDGPPTCLESSSPALEGHPATIRNPDPSSASALGQPISVRLSSGIASPRSESTKSESIKSASSNSSSRVSSGDPQPSLGQLFCGSSPGSLSTKSLSSKSVSSKDSVSSSHPDNMTNGDGLEYWLVGLVPARTCSTLTDRVYYSNANVQMPMSGELS